MNVETVPSKEGRVLLHAAERHTGTLQKCAELLLRQRGPLGHAHINHAMLQIDIDPVHAFKLAQLLVDREGAVAAH